MQFFLIVLYDHKNREIARDTSYASDPESAVREFAQENGYEYSYGSAVEIFYES